MSEFKIIKCKSCDAALVELEGQRLNMCIQCGYDFSFKVNKKSKLESVVEQAFENKFKPKTEVAKTTQKSRNTNPQTTKTTAVKPPNKSFSIVATIIKWYIIIAIASAILKEFF